MLDQKIIGELRTRLRGPLLVPSDTGHDEARQIWNAMINRTSVLITRRASPEDVVQAVNFARCAPPLMPGVRQSL
jgi:hypothetical protein